jgi:two-component sensor histidine kinase
MTTASATDTGERPRTIRVPWSPSAVAKTRRVLVADLDARGVGTETVGEAEIVLSELIANALRHARPLADGMIRVHWKVKGGVVEGRGERRRRRVDATAGSAVVVVVVRPWAAHRPEPGPRVGCHR